jgi:hypothetical protein
VTTSPVLPRQGNFLRLSVGAGTLTFRVRAINTQRVRFYLTPTGTEMFNENQLIGQDTTGRDGWTLAEYDWDNPMHGRPTERWLFMVGHQLIENPSELITLASSQHSCDHGLSGPLGRSAEGRLFRRGDRSWHQFPWPGRAFYAPSGSVHFELAMHKGMSQRLG